MTPPGTTLRAIRIPQDLWDAATDKARRLDTSVSEQVRDMLQAWVDKDQRYDAPSCQHYYIADTGRCVECDEEMIGYTVTPEYKLSAPNIAAGSGMYMPDMARAKRVKVGEDVRYECNRCKHSGRYVSTGGFVPDCGQDHRSR